MREGSADIVRQKILSRKAGVSGKISSQFKGVQPFNAELVTTDEQIWAIERLTFQDMDEIAQTYGPEAIVELQNMRKNYYNRRGNA